eukprot:TRINITY_DN4983_c3_g1_i1.p1 TRINITY_DN4983_c3_g1~~TRINITY_DN4983_c3_g1_i1.p1  ORF type:complete len:798 (+),score=217.05 TRINITY_DN4983_c3_g1_i1:88-2481(+)
MTILPPVNGPASHKKASIVARKSLVDSRKLSSRSLKTSPRPEGGDETVKVNISTTPRGSRKGSRSGKGSMVVEIEAGRRSKSIVSLPQGMEYALKVCSETGYGKVLELSTEENVRLQLSMQDLKTLFEARCKDQPVQPLPHTVKERELRFINHVTKSCNNMHFSLREALLGPASASTISKILSNTTNFAVLDLSANNLKDDGVANISELLVKDENIVKITLQSVGLTSRGSDVLCHALMHNKTVTDLDISMAITQARNHIGPKGGASLKHVLACPGSVLCCLNIASTGLCDHGVMSLSEGLRGNNALTSLNLSDNDITSVGSEALAAVLPATQIEHLEVDRNKLAVRGLGFILGAMGKDPHQVKIATLTAAFNQIGAVHSGKSAAQHATKKLGKLHFMLENSTKLTNMKLDGNDMSGLYDVTSEALAASKSILVLSLDKCSLQASDGVALSLGFSSSLTRLCVSHNELLDEGTVAILVALQRNKTLRTFEADDNRLTSEVVTGLAKVLTANTTLTNVSLKQNNIKSWAGCLKALDGNTALTFLGAEGNPIALNELNTIREVIERNEAAMSKTAVPKLMEKIAVLQQDEADLYDTKQEITIEQTRIAKEEQLLADRKMGLEAGLANIADDASKVEEEYTEVHGQLIAASLQSKALVVSCGTQLEALDVQLAMETRQMNLQSLRETDVQKALITEIDSLEQAIASKKDIPEAEPLLHELQVAATVRLEAENEARRLAEEISALELQLIVNEGEMEKEKEKKKRKSTVGENLKQNSSRKPSTVSSVHSFNKRRSVSNIKK